VCVCVCVIVRERRVSPNIVLFLLGPCVRERGDECVCVCACVCVSV